MIWGRRLLLLRLRQLSILVDILKQNLSYDDIANKLGIHRSAIGQQTDKILSSFDRDLVNHGLDPFFSTAAIQRTAMLRAFHTIIDRSIDQLFLEYKDILLSFSLVLQEAIKQLEPAKKDFLLSAAKEWKNSLVNLDQPSISRALKELLDVNIGKDRHPKTLRQRLENYHLDAELVAINLIFYVFHEAD